MPIVVVKVILINKKLSVSMKLKFVNATIRNHTGKNIVSGNLDKEINLTFK